MLSQAIRFVLGQVHSRIYLDDSFSGEMISSQLNQSPAQRGNPFSLTAEQERIACSPPSFPQVVLAPPGTGKTHTLIARIHFLVEQAYLAPHELLVLCFSRAAVAEVMKRLKELIIERKVHDDLRFVSVRTFDSFANQLLLAGNPTRVMQRESYDERIRQAVQALTDADSPESVIVSEVEHLIVDEIQDLVGIRARLVKALLQRICGGFTLLGDPALAIYGFANQGEERLSSADLLNWVLMQPWQDVVRERELKTNFRSTGKVAEMADQARSIIVDSQRNGVEVESGLKQLIARLPEARLARVNQHIQNGKGTKSVCVLCRTHGELLQIGAMLAAQNIELFIQPKAEEHTLPAWVARSLSECTAKRISQSEYEGLWTEYVGELVEPSARQAYGWLKQVEGQPHDDLNLEVLRARLRKGAQLPDEADGLLEKSEKPMSLSTVHASKGREYDHVVILQPNSTYERHKEDDALDESRVLYVAATRARDELSRLNRDGIPKQMRRFTPPSGRARWLTWSEDSRVAYLELGLPSDIFATQYVETTSFASLTETRRAQQGIWDLIHPGAALEIQKVQGSGRTIYQVVVRKANGEPVKLVNLSPAFWKDYYSIMDTLHNGNPYHHPLVWMQVRAVARTSEVLPAYPEDVFKPYERSGFCLGLRMKGLVEIRLEE